MRALFADAEIIENYSVTAAGTHRELFLEGDLKRVIDSTFDTPQLVDTFFGKSTVKHNNDIFINKTKST